MKIVLLGYMGSGKSTVGKQLAKNTGMKLVDLDHEIERKENLKIPEIFAVKGEIYFRKKESEVLLEQLNEEENAIISLGGGTPCYGNNMKTALEASESVIYLKVSIPGLVQRLSKEKEFRPLIKNIPDEELPEFIGKHLFERNIFYNQANLVIECDGKSPEQISEEIESRLV